MLSSSTGDLVPPPKPQRRIARLKNNKNETIGEPSLASSLPADSARAHPSPAASVSTLDLIEACKFNESAVDVPYRNGGFLRPFVLRIAYFVALLGAFDESRRTPAHWFQLIETTSSILGTPTAQPTAGQKPDIINNNYVSPNVAPRYEPPPHLFPQLRLLLYEHANWSHVCCSEPALFKGSPL